MDAITLDVEHLDADAIRVLRAHVGPHRLNAQAVARILPAPPLLKAESLPEGARWVTVHPHGPGTKGQPLLIQEQKPGSGIFYVIGGAGGSLNYLRLRGVKSPQDYAQDAREKLAADKANRDAKRALDKASGLSEQKKQAAEQARQQVKQAEVEFIQQVSAAMGWPTEPDASAADSATGGKELRANQAKQHAQALRRAIAAVDLQRKAIVEDASLRAAALGKGVPVVSPDAVSVVDLCPARPIVQSGIRAAYGAMAKKAGLTHQQLAQDVAAIKGDGEKLADTAGAVETESGKTADSAHSDGEADAETAQEPNIPQAIADEQAQIAPTADLKPSILAAQKAMALLAARKKLQLLRANARAAGRAAQAQAQPEGKGYVLAVSQPSQDDIAKAVKAELATLSTRTLLAAAAKASEELTPHVADGTAGALHAAALTLTGAGALDRSVVDVLGAGASAQLLARRLRVDLVPEEYERARAAVEAFHTGTHVARAEAVLKQVAEAQAAAAQPLGNAVGADGLKSAAAAHLARAQALSDANVALGRTLGEFEANAALVAALGAPPAKELQVSLGATPLDQAVKQCYALGLSKADYRLQRVGPSVLLTVNASGMDKLAAPVDRDNLERVARNVALARGEFDEDGWLPQGFANRPDLALGVLPGAAPSLAVEFDPGPTADLEQALRQYVGARTADGASPGDIVADIQSAAFYAKAGASRTKEYRAALDAVAPNKIDGKRLQRAEQLAPAFEAMADAYVAGLGGTRLPLHRQTFDADDVGQDAVHRALAKVPEGVAAYKAVGDLTAQDQGGLRGWFARNVAKESPEAAAARAQYEQHLKDEPAKTVEDMFGEAAPNPDWHAWASAGAELAKKAKAGSTTWPDYVKAMGSPGKAYAAVSDLVRSQVAKHFADAYNTARPGALAVGRAVVQHNLAHLSAVDPAAREARAKQQAALIDSLRERTGGKYAAGSVADKLESAAEQKAAFEQSQAGFWSAEPEAAAAKPLAADERHTLGHVAEAKLASTVALIGQNFQPGKPVKLFHASMSGPDGAVRQRAIKHVLANRRSVLGLGVGSGKTGIILGSFAHLHATGQVKKGLIAVPSIVQGQFGGEALRFLKPGQFKWHADPGASYEERLAAYKDPGTHFAVVTHQGFRDDVLRMAAGQGHGEPAAVAAKLAGMTRAGRQAFVADVLAKEGIAFDFTAADEAHGFLDREGKEDSRLSQVVGAVTDAAPYYVHASGDPVKNDASEAFSLLSKMDPARYPDRDAFMRRYGGDTLAAGEALKRELARHVYSAALTPDVKVTKGEQAVALAPQQHAAIQALDAAASKVRLARMQGKTDAAAARAVAPHLFSEGQDEAAGVQQVHDSLPLLREAAVRRIIDDPNGAKGDAALAHVAARQGKPGVIFARSLEAVDTLRQRLEAAGHRVVTITGADSADSKAEKIRAFNPEGGERKADIVLCSDAGAVGANLQSGQWLMQYDTPDTAMVHAQRQGRINRIGQKNAIELTDLVADHPRERRARDRLAKKYGLRELVTTPLAGLDDTGLAFYLKQQQVAAAQAGHP